MPAGIAMCEVMMCGVCEGYEISSGFKEYIKAD
jgi:hypothetical protein